MSEILCSTGAIIGRSNDRNYRLLKPFSEKLNCDGFEFMMYSSWYDEVDSLIDFLQSMEFHIPVMHCEKRMGEAVSKGEFEEAYKAFLGDGGVDLDMLNGQFRYIREALTKQMLRRGKEDEKCAVTW